MMRIVEKVMRERKSERVREESGTHWGERVWYPAARRWERVQKKPVQEGEWTVVKRKGYRFGQVKYGTKEKGVYVGGRYKALSMEGLKNIEARSFTVFVDNLPPTMSQSWLWQIFYLHGTVTDAFVSRKKRVVNNKPFAFVRFNSKKEALKAIQMMNGTVVRGHTMMVREAKFKRFSKEEVEGKRYPERSMMFPNGVIDGRTFKDVVLQKPKGPNNTIKMQENQVIRDSRNRSNTVKGKQRDVNEEKTTVVYGEINDDMKEKLSRSIIGETTYPVNVDVLKERLLQEWYTIVEVKPMGAYKTVLTFESVQDKEDALKLGGDCLKNHFADVRDWSIEEFNQTRRVWIECLGVPPHAWSYENFRKIADVWGRYICLDRSTREGTDFTSAKILIDTCVFTNIQQWIYFSVGGTGYDIFIKEVGENSVDLWGMRNICQPSTPATQMLEQEEVETSQQDGDEEERCLANQSLNDKCQELDNEEGEYEVGGSFEVGRLQGYETMHGMGNDCDVKTNELNYDEEVSKSCGSHTVSLEDDRRTEDLVLSMRLGRSKPTMHINNNYEDGSTKIGLHEVSLSEPVCPPGFGPPTLDPIEDLNQTPCLFSEDNGTNGLRVEDVYLQDTDKGSKEEAICRDLIVRTKKVESEQFNTDDGQRRLKEVTEIWDVGKNLGLSTERDEDAIRALLEDQFEKKVEGKTKKKRNGQRKKKSRDAGHPGVSQPVL